MSRVRITGHKEVAEQADFVKKSVQPVNSTDTTHNVPEKSFPCKYTQSEHQKKTTTARAR